MALPPPASDANAQALVCFKPSDHALLPTPPQRRPRGPGLTISQISIRIGNAFEPVVNSLFRLVGPEHWRSRIEDLFGDDGGREMALDELHRNPHCMSGRLKPLEGHCHELLKLARPESTTVRTQLITFQILVAMITQYPGIRRVLRADKDLRKASATDPSLSSVWKRPYQSGGAAWTFYREFAVFCISDNAFEFTQLLEAEPPGGLSCLTLEHLSEKVLIESLLGHARDGPEFHLSRLCAIRYLAGILELPGFWGRFPSKSGVKRDRKRFLDVLSELCNTILQLLEDTGGDATDMSVDSSPSMDAGRMAVEVLSCSVLNGLLRLHNLNNLPRRRPSSLGQIVSTLMSDRKRFERAFEPASRVKDMFDSLSSPTNDEDLSDLADTDTANDATDRAPSPPPPAPVSPSTEQLDETGGAPAPSSSLSTEQAAETDRPSPPAPVSPGTQTANETEPSPSPDSAITEQTDDTGRTPPPQPRASLDNVPEIDHAPIPTTASLLTEIDGSGPPQGQGTSNYRYDLSVGEWDSW
ncbi:hypothetical protein MVEN_02409800 [Mycena venus]|uniref:Uncharacterized protein n=1 Tax=Mycena venus TaxID=2733690 RepID=A0A8H6X2U4_9AGAR|nr:hypothetical protein MVEN_02409800 [Mycena venus]